jgi:hypothetical protein
MVIDEKSCQRVVGHLLDVAAFALILARKSEEMLTALLDLSSAEKVTDFQK